VDTVSNFAEEVREERYEVMSGHIEPQNLAWKLEWGKF